MKICVVTNCRGKLPPALPRCDVALFGFGALGSVSYEEELSGKSARFEEMAQLSGANRCGMLCGCITDSRGLKRLSVAVADRGRLLGITDMLNVLDGQSFKSGAGLGVYTVGGYKVGVCVENDLFFPECIKSLALFGCNLICVHFGEVSDVMPPLIIRAYAYLYGVPLALCSDKMAYFADSSGVMACSGNPVSVFEASPKNCYRLVTTRRRGLDLRPDADF